MSDHVVIFGAGYVGITLAVHLAHSRRFKVSCVDIRSDIVESINNGISPIVEDGIDGPLSVCVAGGLITAYNDVKDIPGDDPRAYFVTVGTPVVNGVLDRTAINAVRQTLTNCVKPGDFIFLRSTVPVGTTDTFQVNKDVAVAFLPERTVEGDAVNELLTLPQVYGMASENTTFEAVGRTVELLDRMFPSLVPVSNSREAEMVKLMSNTYRDVMFNYANQMASICSDLKISFDTVRKAASLNYDRCKVGRAGPVAGPCLSKDAYILQDSLPRMCNVGSTAITGTARYFSEHVFSRFLKYALSGVDKGSSILILGVAFKGTPSTGDIRDSAALPIIRALVKDFDVHVFDELASHEEMRAALGPLVNIHNPESLSEFINHEEIGAVVVTNDSELWDSAFMDSFRGLPVLCSFVSQVKFDMFDKCFIFGEGDL